METRSMITSDDKKVQTDMERNSVEEHYVIKIPEEQPKLLRTSAARISCCVFRVPQSFINSNGGNAYRPDIVSIGPYHHYKSHNLHEEHKSHELQLQMFEEHKWRYLCSLVSRTEKAKRVGLADYAKAIQSRESEARDCYSETIDLNTKEFVEMMVLDGCFVIELFRKLNEVVPIDEDDPIFSMSWVLPCLMRDLLKLENQIPLFVLQSLFDLSKIPGKEMDASFTKLAWDFFSGSIPLPEKAHESYINELGSVCTDKCPKHLLDFIRSSFIPREQSENINSGPPKNSKLATPMCTTKKKKKKPTRMCPCVTKLRRAGIKCKPYVEDSNSVIQYYVTKLCRGIRCKSNNTGDSPPKNNTFLDIKFRKHAPHGVIEMPSIRIDDLTTAFLLNCVAYEQCHNTTPKNAYFTAYATFMDCLINTREDVGLLGDDDVIENYLGHDKEVAKFFNKFGKDVAIDINSCYLSKVFNDVNEYYTSPWNSIASWIVQWAIFRHKYFDSPWSFMSLVAAVLLLLLTISQTFFAAYDYYQSPKG